MISWSFLTRYFVSVYYIEVYSQVIQAVVPNVVVLELCSSRTNILSLDEKTVLEEAKNIDMQKIILNIRTSGLYNGLMYVLLLNMSAHITKELGMAPGGEFRVAYQEVSPLFLIKPLYSMTNFRRKKSPIVKCC